MTSKIFVSFIKLCILAANPNDINKWEAEGIHSKLKLTTVINLSNMVLHDKNGVLKKYESAKEIMEVFYETRFQQNLISIF